MTEPTPQKIILFIRTVEIPSSRFVDRESIRESTHACIQGGKIPFLGLQGAAHLIGRVYPDADWKALCIAQQLHESNGVEIEVVDVSRSFWLRRRLRRQGIHKTPRFVLGDRILPEIASLEQLQGYCN